MFKEDTIAAITTGISNAGVGIIRISGDRACEIIDRVFQAENKKSESYIRVKLDTENYRARRKETLENLAKNIAFKVKRSKRSFALEPMNPYERRIIHATLQNDKYVSTKSEGEEPYRKVIVYLKKKEK